MGTAGLLNAIVKFDPDADDLAPILGGLYVHSLSDKWSDRLSTGAQFVYADYGEAKIDNDLLKGDYKRNDIFFFAMNANWKF